MLKIPLQKLILGGFAGALLAMTIGCASNQPITMLQPVGPDSNRSEVKTPGFLVVYSDTENPTANGDLMYYPHTSYDIYDSRGSRFRSVPNHMSPSDETPSRVPLPPGNYTVIAQSETDGTVSVPVIIKGLRTTVVNLEKRAHNVASN